MRILLLSVCLCIGLAAVGGAARAQEERGELPDGIRKLIRAADLAAQQAKREGGVADDDADRKARQALSTARRAIRDYYSAKFDYDRVSADTETIRSDAAKADSEVIRIQSETLPNPPRLQKAEEERIAKLHALAEAEIKLDGAREALNAARNPSGGAASSRPGAPPAAPVPDYGTRRPGTAELVAPSGTPVFGCRFIYWNGEGSFHLLNQTGTAYYSRFGQPHLVSLAYSFESQNFFFYRPVSGDPAIVEWAFAKYPECPGFDGELRFAVWCHDRGGWHWEWSCREAICDWLAPGSTAAPAAPSLPAPSPPALLPGPVRSELPTSGRPVVLVAERP